MNTIRRSCGVFFANSSAVYKILQLLTYLLYCSTPERFLLLLLQLLLLRRRRGGGGGGGKGRERGKKEEGGEG